ncbi:MAG TPA: hypothetical protein DCM87_05395 [Planctomycetes bacterium]|nr:hypothetical protein [Planctomycetota bacterium]
MVFARDLDDHLARLAKELDTIAAENKVNGKAFFGFLTAAPEKLTPALEKLAADKSLKIPLTIPMNLKEIAEKFKVPEDTHVMVVLYEKKAVTQVLAYTKADFNQKAVDAAIAAAKKQAKM